MGLPMESNPDPLEFICMVRCLGNPAPLPVPLAAAVVVVVGEGSLDEGPEDEDEDDADDEEDEDEAGEEGDEGLLMVAMPPARAAGLGTSVAPTCVRCWKFCGAPIMSGVNLGLAAAM